MERAWTVLKTHLTAHGLGSFTMKDPEYSRLCEQQDQLHSQRGNEQPPLIHIEQSYGEAARGPVKRLQHVS